MNIIIILKLMISTTIIAVSALVVSNRSLNEKIRNVATVIVASCSLLLLIFSIIAVWVGF
jgi:hypothetical protein